MSQFYLVFSLVRLVPEVLGQVRVEAGPADQLQGVELHLVPLVSHLGERGEGREYVLET